MSVYGGICFGRHAAAMQRDSLEQVTVERRGQGQEMLKEWTKIASNYKYLTFSWAKEWLININTSQDISDLWLQNLVLLVRDLFFEKKIE